MITECWRDVHPVGGRHGARLPHGQRSLATSSSPLPAGLQSYQQVCTLTAQQVLPGTRYRYQVAGTTETCNILGKVQRKYFTVLPEKMKSTDLPMIRKEQTFSSSLSSTQPLWTCRLPSRNLVTVKNNDNHHFHDDKDDWHGEEKDDDWWGLSMTTGMEEYDDWHGDHSQLRLAALEWGGCGVASRTMSWPLPRCVHIACFKNTNFSPHELVHPPGPGEWKSQVWKRRLQ